MTYELLHMEVFNKLAKKEITTLLPIQNVFYYFPPKDQMEIFPRIHFRLENISSNFEGDDKEIINSARVVIDIYSQRPPHNIADKITSSFLEEEDYSTYSSLITSTDSYDMEDCIYGIHLSFQLDFNK